jgi:hypothetical protein
MRGKILVAMVVVAMVAGAQVALAGDICGDAEVFTLWGGKTIDVGTVTVANDEDNLYLTYATSGDWYLQEVQLYVLAAEPTDRLPPGQAPYKVDEFNPYVTEYTFVVPFTELGFDVICDETTLWLQAHASVVKLDASGEEVQGETAYGGEITEPSQGSWYGNIEYTVQCCDDEKCYEFMDETAWAAGSRYVQRGNWATYTKYEYGTKTVTLFAGRTIPVGTVTFSPVVDGFVTITINLTGDWEFDPVEENVKIQNYASAPSGNPSPGLFAYKGTGEGQSFNIDVVPDAFYGVHVDVGYWVEVPCEAPCE